VYKIGHENIIVLLSKENDNWLTRYKMPRVGTKQIPYFQEEG